MPSFNSKDIEILAPVGSWESLSAAIQAGADAVYFGAGKLNMRSRSAAAFSLEDIPKIVAIAAGMRTYLTLNVVIFDEDMEAMRELADKAKQAGVSALIVSDIAAMEYAHSIGMEVHLSTQANVSNTEALRYFARWADTLVLARELSLEQVRKISRAIQEQDIRGPSGRLVCIEFFAHGALCMATSGKCYLSLHQHGASANRGECLQTCRRSYTLTDTSDGSEIVREEDYFLSPKDLKTIGFLDQILEAGVTSLKIEGRSRSAEYVKTTVQCYREAVDAISSGNFTKEKVDTWDTRLGEVFNRGFWDGWYLGQKLGERTASYGSKSTKHKVFLGRCSNYFTKLGVAEFYLEAGSLDSGHEVLISGPTTGVVNMCAENIHIDKAAVESAAQGLVCSFKVPELVRRGDSLFRMDVREIR
ncbi:peptidase U32 family protein [Treponema sp.]